MRSLLRFAIEYLRSKGVEYGDLRYETVLTESIQVRNGVIEGFSSDTSSGVGIRVLVDGTWGFSSTNMVSEEEIVKAAGRAIAIARAFAKVNPVRVILSPNEAHVDSYVSPYEIDPFTVPADEKIGFLAGLTEAACGKKEIAVAEAFMEFERVDKEFLSTEGAFIAQSILTSGGGYHVIAEDGADVQRRSYPDAHHGLFATKGYEMILELKMPDSVARVTEEARALLKAKECPAGKTDVIIDGPQMALQIHESCGHPAELDRVLGSEISFAGGSFLTPDKRGGYRYGSKLVNIYADPTHEGGAGSYRYDDEGVRARRVDLVREGVFVNYLTSRESSSAVGEASNGSMRASSWRGLPLVRMSNICMEPGEASLGEIIADTKEGLLLSTNRSWSIDDVRLNFQFGTEIAYRIRNGRITGIYKNPVYYGITPEFWASCDSIAGPGDWRMWGLNSCAKGEPMQVANVGHGACPARFRNISVGVSREGRGCP